MPFLAAFGTAWLVAYAWCGLSDALDGLLARRLHAASPAGARLDSLADVTFVLAVATSIVPALAPAWQPWMVAWMAAIVAVRLATLVVCRTRFGCFSFLHTWANKATGVVVFAAVALIPVVSLPVAVALSCAVATLSAAEELAIMARIPQLDLDHKGLWEK